MPSGHDSNHANRALFLLPLAALLAIHPLLVHGCSCGHDLVFHVQSWLDAAQQLHHGHYPRWAFSPAWNAGEPRFIFYPPLSWLLGAFLLGALHALHLPIAAAPQIYIFLALTAAGLSMYHLARHFASSNAALAAAAIYLANPYMLFNALERSALAELLAAVWIPLLLLAVLRPRPTIRGVAIPVALLWLTNAPAAVMGCYTFALLAALRVLRTLLAPKIHPSKRNHPAPASPIPCHPERSDARTLRVAESKDPDNLSQRMPLDPFQPEAQSKAPSTLRLALTYILGAALGLALPAFYLVPAAFERRYVQVAMAIIPNLRFQDNFLFAHTADQPHNVVLHTVSVLALVLLLFTVAVLSALLLRKPTHPPSPTPAGDIGQESVISTGARQFHRRAEWRDPQLALQLATTLAILTFILTFLLVPLSTPIWQHLPELAFLQFPWRLLTILAAVLGLSIALLLGAPFATPAIRVTTPGAPLTKPGAAFMTRLYRGMSGIATPLAAVIFPLALGILCYHLYAQGCAPTDRPAFIATLFHTHHGAGPTDEYTPTNADNDILRTDDPGYWLAPNPQAFAPHTIPNPNATDPNYDAPTPLDQSLSTRAPKHLTLNLPQPEDLILNLRDYPDWRISESSPEPSNSSPEQPNQVTEPPHIQRDDGLIAIALPAGASSIDITWRLTPDQELGDALSLCALIALALTFRRRPVTV